MSWWNAKYKNNQGEYEITFASKDYEKAKVVEKVCQAIIDKRIKSREDLKPLLPGWISVEDRLPEPGQRVIATDGAFAGEMYINKLGQWQRYNVNDHSLMMALDILWWMPLPEPPKEEV